MSPEFSLETAPKRVILNLLERPPPPPRAATRMRWPIRPRRANNLSRDARSVASAVSPRTEDPRVASAPASLSLSRPTITTLRPFDAKRFAMAKPIPDVPPTMTVAGSKDVIRIPYCTMSAIAPTVSKSFPHTKRIRRILNNLYPKLSKARHPPSLPAYRGRIR